VPEVSRELRAAGIDVFADWYAAGPNADDCWRDYERSQGYDFEEALRRPAAQNVFEFDKRHLLASDAVVLLCPAGKSGFLELGWSLGRGTPGYILLDNPERWDVMFQFATGVFSSLNDLCNELHWLKRE